MRKIRYYIEMDHRAGTSAGLVLRRESITVSYERDHSIAGRQSFGSDIVPGSFYLERQA
jgi:hypothetical protein